MASYRISEVAERTGFSAPTLRFYEDIGVIASAGRSGNGYRRYDDRDLQRLRFITRSKRLGLSLEEISGLVELLDLEECAPVQERLRELLAAKRQVLAEQIAELESLSAELSRVADRVGVPAPPGACDDSCACFAPSSGEPVVPAHAIQLQKTARQEVPVACTLDLAAMPARLADWHRLAALVVERVDVPDGVHLRFAGDVSPAEVTDLAMKEHACCSFFRFSVGIADAETTLAVTALPEAREMIDVLLPTS